MNLIVSINIIFDLREYSDTDKGMNRLHDSPSLDR